jgi:hypothetical protein
MKFMPSTSPSSKLRRESWLWGASWKPWTIRCLGLMCGVSTVVVLAMVLLQASQFKAQVEKVRSIVVQNEVNARATGAARTTTASLVSPAQANAMNEVVDRLNVPWAHLLNDLETLTPSTIAVLQIEPLVATNALRWQVGPHSRRGLVGPAAHRLRGPRCLPRCPCPVGQ